MSTSDSLTDLLELYPEEVLAICDEIYYSGEPREYRGKTYDIKDLPPDSLYDAYHKKYRPEKEPQYIRGKINVRSDELIEHDYPMGSLAKHDIPKIKTIFHRVKDLTASLKLDGVSMQIQFLDGKLIKAVTRHDHKVGRSIIKHAEKFIPNVQYAGKLVVTGEVLLSSESSSKLGFKHPRSGTAGILADKTMIRAKHLEFYAFDLTFAEDKPNKISEQFAFLKGLGFKVAPHKEIEDLSSLENIMTELANEVKGIPYDGLVISPSTWTTETSDPPKMKVAFKVQTSGEWTTVTDIYPIAQRTGIVIPQVVVEPVEVGGTTISNVGGANYSILVEKGIKIGSRVEVIRAKEVIPYILTIENASSAIEPPIPSKCPSCSTELFKKDRQLICGNTNCPAKSLGRIDKFLGVLGVKGIGQKRLEGLNIDSIFALYDLSIPNMRGLGEKTSISLYEQLRSTIKNVNQGILLAAIGPPLIGEKTAELIVRTVPLERLFGETFPTQELEAISGIGQEKIAQLAAFHTEGRSIIGMLKNHGLTIAEPIPVATTSSSGGTKIVLTGKGNRTRSEYATMLSAKNYTLTDGITKAVSIVVTDNVDGTSAKMVKARSEGKRIITYDELDALLA